MEFRAHVYVMLKPTVNDPQGLTILGGLKSLGFDGIEEVRAGKYFTIRMRASDSSTAEEQVDHMCSKLLANLVIESYRYEVDQI